MELEGIVQNGVIVLEGGQSLPEGTRVRIWADEPPPAPPTIWDKLRHLAVKYEHLPCDLPDDLAANPDHYIHGTPKMP